MPGQKGYLQTEVEAHQANKPIASHIVCPGIHRSIVRVHQYSDGRDCYQTGQSLHGVLTQKAEVGVQIVERWSLVHILAQLRHLVFSLAELNHCIRGATGTSKKQRMNIDYHVEYEQHHYSAPYMHSSSTFCCSVMKVADTLTLNNQ